MTINIDKFLDIVREVIRDKKVPVVDLIAVQTKDPFKVLVATILSARTKDEVTAQASARLFKKAPDLKSLSQIHENRLAKLIYPVGFYKTKAKHLAKLPGAMQEFSGVVPQTIEELIKLPGVGRKTANLVVSVAFNKPAICVDTHVHRIMNIWEYVNTDTPLKTEMVLRDQLPQKHWIPVNSLLVAFGQSICRPVSPHCDICPLNKKCPKKDVQPRKIPGAKMKNNSNLKFISWNVNGIRAVEKKGFIDMLPEFDADVVCLQETKAQEDQLSEKLKNISGYTSYFHSAEKKGYSGVAFYSRLKPLQVQYGLGDDEFDSEGRVISLEFDKFFLINIYFPNSGDKLKRLDYKLRFNQKLKEFAQTLEKQKNVILCGDFNVAHKEIDLKNPKNNVKHAGFTPEERSWMDSFVEAGFIDTFRMFNQDPLQYTWWSYRFSARTKNIGWRIDYFCVDGKAREKVHSASILKDIMGSDHCPIELVYSP
ncbi:MAG: exodeoxyribonuclease III [Desulfobulbaceae bacterium]|nr:exodeoxyribonuclease III [Desulfobulbaceae bacterium]